MTPRTVGRRIAERGWLLGWLGLIVFWFATAANQPEACALPF